MPTLTRPSVLEPVSRAIDRTKRILFQPFEIQKWLVLGFCAWLAYLGESGGSAGNVGNRFRDTDYRDNLESAWDWVLDHLALIVIVVVILLALGVVLMWISSRGKFLFLDGVVHDRAAVTEPWRRFAPQGNSLFALRIVLGLIFLAAFTGLGTFMLRDLLGTGFADGGFGFDEVRVILMWAVAFVPLVLAAVLFALLIEDLVVPIMWLRQVRATAAFREALALVAANLWTFVLYVLFKIVLGIALGLVSCVAVCVTCCIAAVPYLGTVLLLPLFVFRRSYSLEFLAQFGPDYAALAPGALVVPPLSPQPEQGGPR